MSAFVVHLVKRSALKQCPYGLVRHGGTIPVILLDEVVNKGNQGDIVKVKRGFARNFLIPRKLAAYATEENKEKYSRYTTEAAKRAKEAESGSYSSSSSSNSSSSSSATLSKEMLTKALNSIAQPVLTFHRATIPNTLTLFGSVSASDIIQELQVAYSTLMPSSLALSPSFVDMPTSGAIKNIGTFEALIAGVKVQIVVKKEEEAAVSKP